MKRREFMALLGGAAAWPFTARAQQSERTLAGWMGQLVDPETTTRISVFRSELQALGWVEGQTIEIIFRSPPLIQTKIVRMSPSSPP